MTTTDIRWRHNHLATADEVHNLCNELIGYFMHGPVLMPVVVLQAEQPPGSEDQPPELDQAEDPAAKLVDNLHHLYKRARVRCRRFPNKPGRAYALPIPESALPGLPGTLGEYDQALTLTRALSAPVGWDNADRSPYRPYSFPRSALLSAVEEAVAESVPAGEPPDQQAAFKRLNSLRPRTPVSGSLRALRSLLAVLMPLVAIVLSVELTTLSTPRRAPLVLLVTGVVALAGWGVLVFRQSLTAPLSGLFPGSHWFATSTFIFAADQPDDEPPSRWRRLAVLLPGPSRRIRAVREERARMIVGQLSTAYYGSGSVDDPSPRSPAASDAERERAIQLYLSLRVHALLEDLRANYRPWTLDLRRRKRKWPPMLFLPDVDEQPGCVRFVQAVSDLRSRRSETDPLLILASSRHPLTADPGPEPDDRRRSRYRRWISRLRVEQSPSLGKRLPWVLLQEVRAAATSLSTGSAGLPQPGWSAWQLWSRWTVAVAVALLCVGGFWRSEVVGGQYCGGWLFGHDPNLVIVNGECIGTDTSSSATFLPAGADSGVTLTGQLAKAGAAPVAGSPVSLSQVNLAYVENLIDEQNQQATAAGSYVTFVYAGALTAPIVPTDALSAFEELTGLYAWQYNVNVTQHNQVKIRIDIANDGDGSGHERRMAETVVAAADRDPSITGVIGLGVDTSQSQEAVQDFANADLPLLDTTNSDDDLPQDNWDYFGLSATNAEEAQALVSRYARHGRGRTAVVFERVGNDGLPTDPYAQQQAQAAVSALKGAGFTLVGPAGVPAPITYTTQTDMASTPSIQHAVCGQPRPSVIYLAGRYQDMTQLVGLLTGLKNCFPANVTVLSGDDMTLSEFPGTAAAALAPEMRLYYVAQTDPAHVPAEGGSADNGSGLNTDLQSALNLGQAPDYESPVFADGLMALGFDAADVLYRESTTGVGAGEQEQPVPRAWVAQFLRCPQEPVSSGATGPLGFADVRHGLDFFKAVNAIDGRSPQVVTYQSYQPTVPGSCAPAIRPPRAPASG
jgi:hypothetical protein